MQNSSPVADDRQHKPLASQRLSAGRTQDARLLSLPRWGPSSCSSSKFCTRPERSRRGSPIGARSSMPICSGPPRSASGQVVVRGERGLRALFLLPAVLFTVAVVIFPTLFGIYIASLDWNLSSFEGPHF